MNKKIRVGGPFGKTTLIQTARQVMDSNDEPDFMMGMLMGIRMCQLSPEWTVAASEEVNRVFKEIDIGAMHNPTSDQQIRDAIAAHPISWREALQ